MNAWATFSVDCLTASQVEQETRAPLSIRSHLLPEQSHPDPEGYRLIT